MRQEIQQATAKAQSQVETERRQRRADADQLRADVQQMVQAAEVRLAAQLDGQQGATNLGRSFRATRANFTISSFYFFFFKTTAQIDRRNPQCQG